MKGTVFLKKGVEIWAFDGTVSFVTKGTKERNAAWSSFTVNTLSPDLNISVSR
jgi:hypothetical protein